MKIIRYLRKSVIIIAFTHFLLYGGLAFSSTDCDSLNASAWQDGDYITGDKAGKTVTGNGQLQFYSAPDFSCEMRGVFILPGQAVDAYTKYHGFTSVAYLGATNRVPVLGWVKSDRLTSNGFGISSSNPIIIKNEVK